MLASQVVQIETPKGVLLNGLLFGHKKGKRAVILVHGLGGSAFGKLGIVEKLARQGTAVVTFNNRGHDLVANIGTVGGNRIRAGAAHEVFTDCVDDIQGAINFVRKHGIKDIYLAGHSTGCQKSIYWAAKTGGKGVKGIILLAPVSDYAAALMSDKNGKLAKLTAIAQKKVKAGKKHELMPEWILDDGALTDAQRFLSLNTADSVETIFPYEQKSKRPTILQKVSKPILVLWAENDEYSDRPASESVAWFDKNIKAKHTVVIVPGIKHSFKGGEQEVARSIRDFIVN
jgi:alpha-beta hydrolase superfamily lysophospholipase